MKRATQGFGVGDKVILRPGTGDDLLQGLVGRVEGFFGARLKVAFPLMTVFKEPAVLRHWPGQVRAARRKVKSCQRL